MQGNRVRLGNGIHRINGTGVSDMPSANYVWGAYLYKHGYRRKLIEQSERYIYTVNDFCADHPTGTYILCIDSHVVTVQDGKYFDTWDSGNEIPVYYWEKE
jgi:hypothetical protein